MSLRLAGRIWPAGTEPPAGTDQPRGQCPPDAVSLDGAQARGDLPLHLARGTITDVVFGVVWCRLLATREPLGDRLAGEIAGALTGRIDRGERDRVRRK